MPAPKHCLKDCLRIACGCCCAILETTCGAQFRTKATKNEVLPAMKYRVLTFMFFKFTAAVSVLGASSLVAQGLVDDFGLDSKVTENEEEYTCKPEPQSPSPGQHSSAESLPPLPLPVTPQRRTEKKNPPRPPVLIAKIATDKRSDWATNPSDTKNLLKWMAKELDLDFSSTNLPRAKIPSTPEDIPVLYRTGHRSFSWSEQMRKKLRSYLAQGGTLVLDACCGRKEFVKSALKEMKRLFPDRPPYRLTFDHPLYRSFFDIEDVKYRKWARKAGAENGETSAIGIDIECRTAVVFFRWDVSCGWAGLEDSERHHCLGYTIPSARKLGANLMAYVTAERNAAMSLSKAKEFVNKDKDRSGKITIAQVKYDGIWKTREAALPMLLQTFHDETQTPVRFSSDTVSLDSEELFQSPLVYMTGHHGFSLSAAERQNLRKYLKNGGILFAEACCGRSSFDQAFRREIRKVLNGQKLQQLPPDHSIFHFPEETAQTQPRPALARSLESGDSVPPFLKGIKIDGHLGVIYAPYGLACGWELAQCPYCRGIKSEDALALGVNILSYATTH